MKTPADIQKDLNMLHNDILAKRKKDPLKKITPNKKHQILTDLKLYLQEANPTEFSLESQLRDLENRYLKLDSIRNDERDEGTTSTLKTLKFQINNLKYLLNKKNL